jgi:hypothetical protein
MYAKDHVNQLLDANNGTWPLTVKGYIRLLWKVGELICWPTEDIALADLFPDGRGHWVVRYNPSLPEKTIMALLVHEASEYLSRRSGHWAGRAAEAINSQDAEHPYNVSHRLANEVVRLWCDQNGLAFHRVMDYKAVRIDGPSCNFGYSGARIEIERVAIDFEEGRTIGKMA